MSAEQNRAVCVIIHREYYQISEEVLHQVFSQVGELESIQKGDYGSRCFWRIQFQTHDSAQTAIESLWGRCIYGDCCLLEVFWSPSSTSIAKLLQKPAIAASPPPRAATATSPNLELRLRQIDLECEARRRRINQVFDKFDRSLKAVSDKLAAVAVKTAAGAATPTPATPTAQVATDATTTVLESCPPAAEIGGHTTTDPCFSEPAHLGPFGQTHNPAAGNTTGQIPSPKSAVAQPFAQVATAAQFAADPKGRQFVPLTNPNGGPFAALPNPGQLTPNPNAVVGAASGDFRPAYAVVGPVEPPPIGIRPAPAAAAPEAVFASHQPPRPPRPALVGHPPIPQQFGRPVMPPLPFQKPTGAQLNCAGVLQCKKRSRNVGLLDAPKVFVEMSMRVSINSASLIMESQLNGTKLMPGDENVKTHFGFVLIGSSMHLFHQVEDSIALFANYFAGITLVVLCWYLLLVPFDRGKARTPWLCRFQFLKEANVTSYAGAVPIESGCRFMNKHMPLPSSN